MKKAVLLRESIVILIITVLLTLSACKAETRSSDNIPVVGNASSTSEDNSDPPVQNHVEPPLYSDHTIDTAVSFADYFVDMLNAGQDLIGDVGAMESWRDLFSFGQTPVYHSGLSEVEYSDNVYQFVVSGKKGEIVNSATVLINLQGDEPFYSCAYTRYYPYVSQTATTYVELLSAGDIEQLAIWLSVDGGQNPTEDFIEQARWGVLLYYDYGLHDVMITGIWFDNEAQRFYCGFEDSYGASFDIPLSFGDGLIMPERIDLALNDCSGLTIAIPNKYIDSMIIRNEKIERDDATVLISVYERRSVEDYEKDGGERFGMGGLFSILRFTQAQYDMFLNSPSDGMMIFARDNDYYYCYAFGTDPWAGAYRINNGMSEADWWEFNSLLGMGDRIVADMITRNTGLTVYSEGNRFI